MLIVRWKEGTRPPTVQYEKYTSTGQWVDVSKREIDRHVGTVYTNPDPRQLNEVVRSGMT